MKKEIEEGNILIAEFMGIKDSENEYSHKSSEYYFEACELEYHFSWDSLMPCFDKLRKYQCSYKISEEYCEIKSWIGQFNIECVYENTIESAFNCMIKFIKWYNENKTIT